VVDATAAALVWYAVALFPVAAVRVLAPAFYALKDTRTPVAAAFWALWVNLAASLVFMGPMKHAGLALATAVSSGFNLAYLGWRLKRRMGPLGLAASLGATLRMVLAAAAMAGLVAAAARWVAWNPGRVSSAGALALLVVAGAGIYLVLGRLLGVREATRLWGAVARRVGAG
jgi:putative peptidoglycan lipid II flippase